MVSGSLLAYQDGEVISPETKQQFLVRYNNILYLGMNDDYGAIQGGLAEGVYAWFGVNIEEVNAALELDETNRENLRLKAKQYKRILVLVSGFS